MKTNSESIQSMPLDIVGSSTFGRDPKILASRTFNMITADDWLIDYAGYEKITVLSENGNGRGIFTSIKANKMIAVVGNQVFSITTLLTTNLNEPVFFYNQIGTLDSFSGNVFIDENNNNQIAICDQHSLYIYNYVDNTFKKAILPDGVIPGYVTYQDGRFIITDLLTAAWYLSQVGDGLNWFWGASGEPVDGSLQTKPDYARAALRFPGHGNLLFVMGETVTELWTDVGNSSGLPYQRSSSINFDYGCLNQATIAISDQIVCWLGTNEKSGPVIMYSTGSDIEQISTDGINYKLSTLNFPEKSSAFFVKLAGHLIYQLTFYDPSDNYSLIYDFTTKKFFDVTNENNDFHIALRVAFFEDDYYFVSYIDGALYRMSADLFTFNYGENEVFEIPRMRIGANVRMPNSFRFVVNNITFLIEQGNDFNNLVNDPSYQPRIALSISKDGGYQFSSYLSRPVYTYGNRINRLNWWNLGACNDFVPQFRFWGKGPWRCFNGVTGIYQ